MRKLTKIFLAAIVFFSFLFVACDTKSEWHQKGTMVAFTVDSGYSSISMGYELYGENAKTALEKMRVSVGAVNDAIAPENFESELYAFNNELLANEPMKISHLTYDLIKISKEMKAITQGLFDPGVYPLMKLWNLRSPYTTFHTPPDSIPTIDEVEEALKYSSIDLVEIFENDETGEYYATKSDSRVMIEFGAIAKGYAADLCRDIFREFELEYAMVNISGNVYVYNDAQEKKDWNISLSDPRSNYEVFYSVREKTNSLVSSGDYNTYYMFDQGDGEKIRVSHILDPRTGIPLNLDWNEADGLYRQREAGIIATIVVGESSTKCDVFTTAAILGTIEEGINFLEEQSYCGFLIREDKVYAKVGEFRQNSSNTNTKHKEYTLF